MFPGSTRDIRIVSQLSPYVSGAAIETERPSPRYSAIDLWESSDVLDAMIEGQLAAVAAVRASRGAIEEAAHALELRWSRWPADLAVPGPGEAGNFGGGRAGPFSWPAERLLL
jgi:N-acetylmuramic acid 6-phosphate etherase